MQAKHSIFQVLNLLSILITIGLFVGLSTLMMTCSEEDDPEDTPPVIHGGRVNGYVCV